MKSLKILMGEPASYTSDKIFVSVHLLVCAIMGSIK